MKGQLAAFLDPQGVGAFLDHQAVRGLVDGGGAEVKVQALQQLVPGLAVPGGQGVRHGVHRADRGLRQDQGIGVQALRQGFVLKGQLAPDGRQALLGLRQGQVAFPDLAPVIGPRLFVVIADGIHPAVPAGEQEAAGGALPLAVLAGEGHVIEKIVEDPLIPLGDGVLPILLGGGLHALHMVDGNGEQGGQAIVVQAVHRVLVVLHAVAAGRGLDEQGHRGLPGEGGVLHAGEAGFHGRPCASSGEVAEHARLVDEDQGRADQDGDEKILQAVDALPVFPHAFGPSRLSSMRRVVPGPGRSTSRSLPSCCRMISLAMDRPRPVPPDSRERALSTR